MPTTYEWLFEKYVSPRVKEIGEMGDQTAEALINRLKLTDEERMAVWDTLGVLRYQWGMEVFALGLQLGVRLTAPSLSVEDHP
jgi:hypothetical protein